MSPSFEQLKGVAGNSFRFRENQLPAGSVSQNEWYRAVEAPAPGKAGRVVLVGQVKGVEVIVGSSENVFSQKKED